MKGKVSLPQLSQEGQRRQFPEQVWSILYQAIVIADLPPPQTLHQVLVQDSWAVIIRRGHRQGAARRSQHLQYQEILFDLIFNIWGFNISTNPDLWDPFLEF